MTLTRSSVGRVARLGAKLLHQLRDADEVVAIGHHRKDRLRLGERHRNAQLEDRVAKLVEGELIRGLIDAVVWPAEGAAAAGEAVQRPWTARGRRRATASTLISSALAVLVDPNA